MASASEKIYAQALFSLAQEENNVNEIYKDLTLIYKVISKDLTYLNIFNISSVSKEEKRQLILNAFESYVSKTVCDFLCLLVDKGRTKLLPSIIPCFRELYNDYYEIVDVSVTTSIPLDNRMKERIIHKIKGMVSKNIILHEKIDKDILGGIIVEYNGARIDVSAKKELDNMKSFLKSVTV